jgi:PAS domain S-box-containing protein
MFEVTIRGDLAHKLMLLAQRQQRTVEDSLATLVDNPSLLAHITAADAAFHVPQAEQRLHELESANHALTAEIERLRQAEDELRRHEKHLRIIYDISDVGLVLADPKGNLLNANPAFCRMLGYEESELHGLNFRAFSDSDAVPHEVQLLQDPVQGKAPVCQLEKEYIRRDGSRLWGHLTISIHRDEQGQIQHLIGIVKDVSERREMQEALRISEQRYRSVVTAMSEGVVLYSADGQITACNAPAERILGLSADQIVGRSSEDRPWHTIHEDGTPFPAEAYPAMVTLRTGIPMHQVVMGVHRPNGSLTWLSINSEPIFIAEQAAPHSVVVSFNDITERKRTEQQLFELALEKERAHILAQFIMDASHEFRNALAVINSHAYLLANASDLTRREGYYRRVGWATQRMSGLLDAMLEIIELENQAALLLQEFNLNDLMQSLVTEMGARFSAKQQTVQIVLSQPPLLLYGDSKKLRRAIFHLLDNAHKFTGEGGTITISMATNGSNVSVSVSDTGKGMSQEVQARIFERFFRDDPARTVHGFGLGLTIAQKVIHHHRGTIEVQSEVGQGSRFTVTLPREG